MRIKVIIKTVVMRFESKVIDILESVPTNTSVR